MREEAGIRGVKAIIKEYAFNEPFAKYLKKYFKVHSQMGSRDRRQARNLSFNFFRIGKTLNDLSFENRLAVSCFLCEEKESSIVKFIIENHSSFNVSDLSLPLGEKILIVKKHYERFNEKEIFSFYESLSPEISGNDFSLSFLIKPRVWIRVREKYLEAVLEEFREKNFEWIEENYPLCFSFENEVQLDKTESFIKGYFEIQDKNSQRTRDYLHAEANQSWWDACCGSGGKSLLLIEADPGVAIYATDIRASMLKKYQERMQKTGFRNFELRESDLSDSNFAFEKKSFDGIIADVPCTGTGTWARTPEFLHKKNVVDLVEHFVPLQRSIITNILPSLKVNSPLVYITCSVLKKENEENVEYFLKHLPLKLGNSDYLEGYASKGDTLFVARFLKIS